MSPVAWALSPLVITALGWAVVGWRARSQRRTGNPLDTVDAHERFRAALAGRAADRDRPGAP